MEAALVFVLLAVAAVLAAATTDAWWRIVLALGGLAIAATGVLVAFVAFQRDDGDSRSGKTGARAISAVAALTVILAIVLPREKAANGSPVAPTAQAAVQTVRSFVVTSVIDDNPVLACKYMTATAQQRVARLSDAPSCQAALTATAPTWPGVQSVADVESLPMRATLQRDRASVVAVGPGRKPVTFVLRPATPAELFAFEAPGEPWRIESGFQALL